MRREFRKRRQRWLSAVTEGLPVRRTRGIAGVMAAGFVLSLSPVAQACAVCFGKSDDPMVRGTAAGVVFLAAVVYGVLFMFAGAAGLFFLKARRMRMAELGDGSRPRDSSL